MSKSVRRISGSLGKIREQVHERNLYVLKFSVKIIYKISLPALYFAVCNLHDRTCQRRTFRVLEKFAKSLSNQDVNLQRRSESDATRKQKVQPRCSKLAPPQPATRPTQGGSPLMLQIRAVPQSRPKPPRVRFQRSKLAIRALKSAEGSLHGQHARGVMATTEVC